ITNTGDEAIFLEYSNNTIILNNKIYDCSGSGISLSDANNITIFGNSFYNSSNYGIFLTKSTNDTVIWTNTFQNNNLSNAFDNSTGTNFWDNGTHGNWWDDYTGVDPEQDGIGNTPYNISGGVGAQDRYPLMEIFVVITTTPTSLNGTQGIPFFFDFNVTAPYSEILTWSLAGNCTSWLTINGSTGKISGIPGYNSIGTWNVTVSVIDENSVSDIYTVFLTLQTVTIYFTEVTGDQNMLLFDIIQLYVRVETDIGKPAEGVAVEWWKDNTFLGSNTTNSTGYSTWALQLTTPKTYHIEAKVPARSLQANISLPTEALEFWFNGLDNETEPVQLTIGTNYTISGKLVDSTGDPVSGVEVEFVIDDLTISPISTVITGWVNTTHLFSTEGTYTITATKDGFELPIGEDRAELTVYVSTTSVVVAFITPSTNTTETVKGVPTLFVGWIYFDEKSPISAAGIRVGLLVNGTQVDSLFSNKNGYINFSYTFPNIGTYQVAFYYNEQSWGEIWVTVTAGYFANLDGSSIVNGTSGQELKFTIYVLSNSSSLYRGLNLARNDGTPIIGAQVDWYINNAYQNTTKTGLGGRTSFSYIFAIHGFYRVVAKHEGQILATFEVTISEKTKEDWEKFVEDYATLLTVLAALFCIFLVMGAIPKTRRMIVKVLKRIQALITRKAVFGPKYCARVLGPELEEKVAQEVLQAEVTDPSKLASIRREVSAKLTRFPEFMTKSVEEKVKFTQKTSELILKRYSSKK
ncbi:MAG: NosD domain-containing protein, partial [Candidatus Hodarchaeota archaeon]